MRILGVDPSLTGTGLALLDTNDALVVETRTTGVGGDRPTRRCTTARARLMDLVGDVVDASFAGVGPSWS